ncbi:MAG: APC family permease [Acidimicrobiia bacterium]
MTDITASAASETDASTGVIGKGLKVGALGLLSAVVIGVASTAPGYSLAASIGFVSEEVGDQAPAVLILSFLPMLFIAAAYFYMNRADPDCGTAFTWASRAFGPKTGWITGWAVIVADLLVMPSLAGITGEYFFLLFGKKDLADNAVWTTTVGVVFILLMTLICVIGIELNKWTQFFLLAFELVILVVFSIVALGFAFSGHVADGVASVKPKLSWFNPLEIQSASALSAGLLIAIFLYWGWDTAVSVNEETKDSKKTPGKAAVISTVVLVLTYIVSAAAVQSVGGSGFMTENQSDVLSAAGALVLGGWVNKLLIFAVLTSAAASTQTTILPAARSSLSMAVHKALPQWFGKVSPKFLTPANTTWAFGILAVVWYVGLTVLSEQGLGGDVLGDSITGVGYAIAFYYAATGFACVWYYRRSIFKSAKNFFFVGVAPILGAATLAYAFGKSAWDSLSPDPDSYAWFGLAPSLFIGVGLIVGGIPLMLGWWAKAPTFFRRKADPLPHPEPDGSGAPVPPLSESGPVPDDLGTYMSSSGGH